MPYYETTMDEFLEIANESIINRKKTSDELLKALSAKYRKQLKTVGDCDDQLLIINNEGRKFNECMRTLKRVKAQYDQGKLNKKQFNEQFKAAVVLLKKNCKNLQFQLGNVVDDASAVTVEEINEFNKLVAGLKKIVTGIKKDLMKKPAKESYVYHLRSALEGEFDLETLEEEEKKDSKKDKDDDDDDDKDDDKDKKKKSKKKDDDSEDDFDGESLFEDEDDDDDKKDKDDDDDSDDDDDDDKDDDDKDDKKSKKKKSKKDSDDDDDDDDSDDDDDEDSDDEDDDKDTKKKSKKKDKDDDDEDDDEDDDDKKEAKESAHAFSVDAVAEALTIVADWGVEYGEALEIALNTINPYDYGTDVATEDAQHIYVHNYHEKTDAQRKADAAVGMVQLGVAGGAIAADAALKNYFSKVTDYRDMPNGPKKDEFGFQLAEKLRKNKALAAGIKMADKWDRLPAEFRMYYRDQQAIPYGKNGVPQFSTYRSRKKSKKRR